MTLSELLRDSLSDALGQTEVKTAEPETVPSGFSSEEVKKLSSFLEDFASNYGQLVETLEKEAGPIHSFRKWRNRDIDMESLTPEQIHEMSKNISPGKAKSLEKMMRTNKKIERSLVRSKGLSSAAHSLGGPGKLLLLGLGAGVGGALLGSQMQRNKDVRDMQAAMYSQPSVGGV